MAHLAVVVIAAGDEIPEWVMPSVRPERMRTTAAILRDPNPVHWDPASTESRGLDGRLINQGPLNVGYLANMLMAWQGPACLRRLQTSFHDRVLDGEHITARGVVIEVEADAATCEVWLEKADGSRPVKGVAVVAIDPAAIDPAAINPAAINPAAINPAAINPGE